LEVKLDQIRHWIFDMDGTLTVPMHDFDDIRAALGLPEGIPILEAIDTLPERESEQISRRLDEIEFRIASQAEPQPGAQELLRALERQGSELGILTRNNRMNALETLRVCSLLEFFQPEAIVGREAALPKPDPEGVNKLLRLWNARPADSVIVGDYLFDMQAGREAGTLTVYVGPREKAEWRAYMDVWVKDLRELRILIEG
jgi:HAD superfamily hydrolase (TIGR01509 family)